MNADLRRWAQRADQLRFGQLEVARKQAESWRTGLAGLTGLLGAVLIVKGKDTVSDLAAPYIWIVISFLALALAGLVTATLTAIRASSGTPGDDLLLSGEDLQRWTRREVLLIGRHIRRARALTIAALALVSTAVGLSWVGPTTSKDFLVMVHTGAEVVCGVLLQSGDGETIIKTEPPGEHYRVIRLAAMSAIKPVKSC
ncbi:hypothetical protein [Herbidospora sp. NBRC 101105]|uniref:hypothetical protein n=1 Tax=Herbidospora sp. NBRC 101105 TaxID=3032195 RepID=UPI0024A40917|nr:hypothetical protein [Herbidospora sp. NBRC 101105]GLX93225.1 hypothetical protein Hesp01_11750 [Herbidospora sp. NBRC 101105]